MKKLVQKWIDGVKKWIDTTKQYWWKVLATGLLITTLQSCDLSSTSTFQAGEWTKIERIESADKSSELNTLLQEFVKLNNLEVQIAEKWVTLLKRGVDHGAQWSCWYSIIFIKEKWRRVTKIYDDGTIWYSYGLYAGQFENKKSTYNEYGWIEDQKPYTAQERIIMLDEVLEDLKDVQADIDQKKAIQ